MRVRKFLPGEAPTKDLAWSLTIQGKLVQLRRTSDQVVSRPPRPHGPIRGYSPQARMRALRTVARIDWAACQPSVFVELGYPDSVVALRYEERTRQLELFRKSVERHLGRKVFIFWRWEWEIRKSGIYKGFICPHVHLMICRVRYICRDLLRGWWRRVLDVSGPLHTDVRKIYGADGAGRYLTRYITKTLSLGNVTDPEGNAPDGKSWGIFRRGLVPWCEERIYPGLPETEVEFLKTIARNKFAWYGQHGEMGFTLLGGSYPVDLNSRYFSGLDRGETC